MKRIVFATNNQHKLQEIRDILGSDYEVVSLKEIGCDVDIPETGNTLEENALQKAQYVYDHYHVSCFADDTGLEVEALDGAPGVHSARYAEGTDHDSEANMAKLLRELDGKENRQARYLLHREAGCMSLRLHQHQENSPVRRYRKRLYRHREAWYRRLRLRPNLRSGRI